MHDTQFNLDDLRVTLVGVFGFSQYFVQINAFLQMLIGIITLLFLARKWLKRNQKNDFE